MQQHYNAPPQANGFGGGWNNNGWSSDQKIGFGRGGFNSGWDRAASTHTNADDKGKGDFVRSGNHPFVLHKQLNYKRCKSKLTTDMVCCYGNNCKFDHTKFDDWSTSDENLQIEHIRENSDIVIFNAKTVKSLPPGTEGLLRSGGEGSS